MKKQLFILAFLLFSCLEGFSQATSLTIDCQTPGWLSSMINYGDQQTLENLKVTGYINGTDIQFIYDLNDRSLTGVIDLEDVSIVKGGTLNDYPRTVENDNEMPSLLFEDQKNRIQKFIYPKTLVKEPSLPKFKAGVDSVIWTSLNVKSLNISNGVGGGNYVYIPEGIEEIKQIPSDISIVFPSTINKLDAINNNLTIYSFIENPKEVFAQYETYYSNGIQGYRNYWAAIVNSTFYIPKGTMEKYLDSDFAKMQKLNQVNGNYSGSPNGNVFIEYYDVEETEISAPEYIYKGETCSTNVVVHPDANLVSWIDYKTSDPEVVSINSGGTIDAKDYGQAEISATPHVFIDGLETKTGSCVVKVVAHTEGVEIPSSLEIQIGEQKKISAFTLPLDITDNRITFSVNDPSIAELLEDGIVKGNKKGICIITATSVDGGYTATCNLTVTNPKYDLTYLVDDEVYKTVKIEVGSTIIPEAAPTKEGYTFSGWSWIPTTMPEQDVTVTGTFVKDSEKCATPTINVEGGQIKLSCETPGVTYVTSYTAEGVFNTKNGNEIITSGPVFCHLSVYATKKDYQNSDIATIDVELCVGKKGDVNQDGVVTITDAVSVVNIILNEDGTISAPLMETPAVEDSEGGEPE
jgi:hypothetical protein